MRPRLAAPLLVVALATVAPAPATLARPAAPDTLAARVAACTGCHGDQGRATTDGYQPRIAGKPEGYLLNQLLNFRDARRPVPVMTWMVDHLPEAYLREIAAHFAALDPPYPPPAATSASPAELDRGRTLALRGDAGRALPACVDCHGAALMGVRPAVPGLLGLPRDYLNAQFGAWRNGARRAMAPDCMAEVAHRMAPDDIAAVTAWLASQPVTAGARPADAAPARLPLDCGGLAPTARDAVPAADGASTDPAARGAYLALAGNCAGCHTVRGGAPYAGGRGIDTPFGTIRASNLTPDPDTGLGRWSRADFGRAMRDGVSRDGRPLYPAFPYPDYTRLHEADVDALWAYLRTLAPVRAANAEHALRFPWNLRPLLWAWRALYFRPGAYRPDTSRDAAWNRGAYLVEALGHCGACHTARGVFGGPAGAPLDGGLLQAQGWWAPSLRRPADGGVQRWSHADTVTWLGTGRSAQAVASGPMAEVVIGSLQHLSAADLEAMATYLRALPPLDAARTARRAALATVDAPRGAALYRRHCEDCHGAAGEGVPPHWPPLAGNRTLTADPPVNAIRAVLHGGFAPGTRGNPRPHGMPPTGPDLSDDEVATLLTWLRSSWGHAAGAIEPREVNRLRGVPVAW